MSWRTPRRGLKQAPTPDVEVPSKWAELHVLKIQVDGELSVDDAGDQIVPAVRRANRIIVMLRNWFASFLFPSPCAC
jgi:hypothetical protein